MMKDQLTRRDFVASTTAALSASALLSPTALAQSNKKPNILWITSEDNGPALGAYGCEYADTPNLDQLAAKGTIYTKAWSTAPVCAPARTTIISGVYPPCTGSEHMRSMVKLPSFMKMFPQYLREAGYYCTNNSKEDYNLEKTGEVWDESSGKAHYNNRKEGQPFFAVFNFTTTHESQIRSRPHDFIHDPDEVPIPAYHPDTPETRKDWAQYHDKMTQMDSQAGKILKELEAQGLADDTIVFYYGDHGAGMPRSKRWPYNSGLHVPMIVYIPEKFKHLASPDYEPGGQSDRLVGFIDLAPTVLSLAGIEPKEWMQGHAFLGEYQQPEPVFAFGFRGRMDERYDMVRVARDQRFIYIRNYMPHKVYGQHINYMFQTPTTQVWKELYDKGDLEPPKTYFWETKPSEELYDLENDPDEVNNLVGKHEYQKVLQRLRQAQQEIALKIRDIGFLPEDEIHSRAAGTTPYEMGHDSTQYPMERIKLMAEFAASNNPAFLPALKYHLNDPADSAIRYWCAMGILINGKEAVLDAKSNLQQALQDESPSVRIVAAEALGRYGSQDDADKVIPILLDLSDMHKHGVFNAMMALNAIDKIDRKDKSILEKIKTLPDKPLPDVPGRYSSYVPRLLERITETLAS